MKEVFDKETIEFAKFLDELYREHHNNLDRLGKTGILKLSEVIVSYPNRIIKKLEEIE